MDCKAFALDQARFLQIQVEMPIDKPIRHGVPVLSPEGDQVWVAFQYEQLLGLCFHCGLLGHEAKSCTVGLREGKETPYGDWLRAGFWRPKIQQTRTSPRPSRQEQGDTSARAPPSTCYTPEADTPPSETHVSNGIAIDEEVTDIQLAIKRSKEISVSTQSVLENSPDIMIHTNFNGIEHNPENHGSHLVSVPISYVENVESKDSEALATTNTS